MIDALFPINRVKSVGGDRHEGSLLSSGLVRYSWLDQDHSALNGNDLASDVVGV